MKDVLDMSKKKKTILWMLAVVLLVLIAMVIGGGCYMLDYSLAPREDRTDTAMYFRRQFKAYPETQPWVDSLRRRGALRDTFMTMPTGERHHALYVRNSPHRTALVVHGWRDCGIRFLYLARLYERELGYSVVIPDLHAHGLSEGDRIQMGWLDRKDLLCWLKAFQTDTMVVHGVSMGAATTMMLSAEPLPEGISDIRFVEDCGYTSVWEEFAGELQNQFGLPEFPLMFTASLLCRLRYGWSFGEASALDAVQRTTHPMLFIHGSRDTFVPTEMVHRLYAAKPGDKALWIAPGVEHAESYLRHKEEYTRRVREFLKP